jgi:hypothetical protein
MAPGRPDTPASGRLLAATLQTLDGDGYRPVDAGVSVTHPGLLADLPTSSHERDDPGDFRFRGAVRGCL